MTTLSDLPIALEAPLADRLARALDVERKIPRALDALGPVAGRNVLLVDTPPGLRSRQLAELGGRVRHVAGPRDPDGDGNGADVVVGLWTAFRGVDAADLEAVDARLRPGGRLLVVHDYGRDDVSRLHPPDRPEYGLWSRRDGPFLGAGFRVRVLHCWWTFESVDDARSFLEAAFGPAGAAVAGELRRPRLSYNVAVYHRGPGGEPAA